MGDWSQFQPATPAPGTGTGPDAAPAKPPVELSWDKVGTRVQPAVPPSWVERNVTGPVSEAVTGAKRTVEPNAPEATGIDTGSSWGNLKAAAGYAFATDPAALQDIFLKILPDAKRAFDAQGNPMIEYRGVRHYMNKPGASGADMANIIGLAASTIGVGKLLKFLAPAAAISGGAAQKIGNMVPKMLRGTFARGAAETAAAGVADDAAARALGSDQTYKGPFGVGTGFVDPTKFLIGGVAGGAGAVVIPRIVSYVVESAPFQKVASVFRNKAAIIDAAGNLTPTAERVLQAAGVDSAQLTPETIKQIADEFAKRGFGRLSGAVQAGKVQAGDEARAIVGGALSSQEGIPLSRANRTGNVSDWAEEERMARGLGREASDAMTGFRNDQRGKVLGAVERRANELGGGTAPASEAEVGQTISGSIKSGYGRAKAATDAAYTAADDAAQRAGGVYFTPKNADRIGVDANNALIDANMADAHSALDRQLYPKAASALDMLDGLINTQPGRSALSLRQLENARKRIGRLLDGTTDLGDKKALAVIKDSFDQSYGDIIDEGLAAGTFTPQQARAVDLLKQARAARTQQRMLYEPQDKQDVVGRMIKGYAEDANPTHQAIANDIYGAGRIGQTGTAIKLIDRLKATLEPDAWNAVRAQAVKRSVLGNADKQATGDIGYKQMSNNLDYALDGAGRQFMEKLLTPAELTSLRQLRATIKRLVPAPGTTNPSGSAAALSDIVYKMMGSGGALAGIGEAIGHMAGFGGGVGAMLGGAAGAGGGGAVRGAVNVAKTGLATSGRGALQALDRLHLGAWAGAAGSQAGRGLLDAEQ